MDRTHDEPNWRASGGGHLEIEKTEMKSKQKWFSLLPLVLAIGYWLLVLAALAALVIYGIFQLPFFLRYLINEYARLTN